MPRFLVPTKREMRIGLRQVLEKSLRCACSHSGIALPMALGFMIVISIMLVAVVGFSSANQRSSEVSQAEGVSIAVAEAALNEAQAILANSPTPGSTSALPSSATPGSAPVPGGTATYWGSLDTAASPPRWTVTSVSDVRNPSGGTALSHTATAQFDVVVPIAGNEAWNYVFSDAPGCTWFENSVSAGAPIYTKGDLCLKNSASAVGPQVDVYGAIQLENSSRIGTSTSDASDPAVRTRLGCRNSSSPPNSLPCPELTYAVYRRSFSNATPNVTKPPFDTTKRSTAKPGPLQPCTVSSGSVPSFTTTGAVDLMPNASYTCQVWQGGNLVGELSWDNDPADKLLTIKGTIWFDGELVMSINQSGRYVGRASIYVARKVNISNATRLCATSDCANAGWNPDTTMLMIASGAPDVPAFEMQNSARFQGAIYAVGGFKLHNSAEMRGPVIGSVVEVVNSSFPEGWPPLTSLLDGMPSNTGPSVIPIPNSWRG